MKLKFLMIKKLNRLEIILEFMTLRKYSMICIGDFL